MKILCFGDSNTYGYDPCSFLGSRYAAEDRWPDILAKVTGWNVINAGQNGREIPRHSFEMTSVLQMIESQKPDEFWVMLGTNDLLQGASPACAATRMHHFLQQLPPNMAVHLIAPPPLKRGAWVYDDSLVMASIRLAEEYKQLASQLGIPFADTAHWELQLTFDGVHLTEKDHHLFAQKIQKEVVR